MMKNIWNHVFSIDISIKTSNLIKLTVHCHRVSFYKNLKFLWWLRIVIFFGSHRPDSVTYENLFARIHIYGTNELCRKMWSGNYHFYMLFKINNISCRIISISSFARCRRNNTVTVINDACFTLYIILTSCDTAQIKFVQTRIEKSSSFVLKFKLSKNVTTSRQKKCFMNLNSHDSQEN